MHGPECGSNDADLLRAPTFTHGVSVEPDNDAIGANAAMLQELKERSASHPGRQRNCSSAGARCPKGEGVVQFFFGELEYGFIEELPLRMMAAVETSLHFAGVLVVFDASA